MNHGKKKFSSSQEVSKKGPPLGLALALSVVGGAVLGSAVTYSLFKPSVALEQSAAPAVGATPQANPLAMPTMPTLPQQQFTPAPQPPGEVPPGKVWSPEHGHWHDVPVVPTIPATATPTPPE
jgi:hypothetical protein